MNRCMFLWGKNTGRNFAKDGDFDQLASFRPRWPRHYGHACDTCKPMGCLGMQINECIDLARKPPATGGFIEVCALHMPSTALFPQQPYATAPRIAMATSLEQTTREYKSVSLLLFRLFFFLLIIVHQLILAPTLPSQPSHLLPPTCPDYSTHLLPSLSTCRQLERTSKLATFAAVTIHKQSR